MNYLKLISDPAWWHSLTGNEFRSGFITGLCMVLFWVLLLIILRGIFAFVFRTRRCSSIEVRRDDGSTMINREVIASVVERELSAYPALGAEKIVLTRRGRKYQLTVYCSYLLSDQSGIPAFCDEFKPKLRSVLEKGFGITELEEIRLWICSPDEDVADPAESSHVQEKDAYIGL